MSRTISTTVMINQLEGLIGTRDLNEREHDFVEKLVRLRDSGQVTGLSEGQVEYLQGLHRRHFA